MKRIMVERVECKGKEREKIWRKREMNGLDNVVEVRDGVGKSLTQLQLQLCKSRIMHGNGSTGR